MIPHPKTTMPVGLILTLAWLDVAWQGMKSAAESGDLERFRQKGLVAPVVSLPSLLAPYSLVDLLDCDVQGAECVPMAHPDPRPGLVLTWTGLRLAYRYAAFDESAFTALNAKVCCMRLDGHSLGSHGLS